MGLLFAPCMFCCGLTGSFDLVVYLGGLVFLSPMLVPYTLVIVFPLTYNMAHRFRHVFSHWPIRVLSCQDWSQHDLTSWLEKVISMSFSCIDKYVACSQKSSVRM